MSKASEEALGSLHAALAVALKDNLFNEDGSVNTAALSVARQFLKDNHIEVGVGAAPGVLHGLAGLPVFDDDNVVPIKAKG